MQRSRLSIALAALAVLAARAAGAASHHPTLDDVNRSLEDRTVVITLMSGDVIRDVTEVVVGPEQTSYRPRPNSEEGRQALRAAAFAAHLVELVRPDAVRP